MIGGRATDADVGVLESVFPGIGGDGRACDVDIVEVAAGELLCSTGDAADVAWVVLHGRLRILADRGEGVEVIGDVGPGAVIGEAGLLEGGTRSATVVGRRDASVAAIDRAAIARMVVDDPGTIGRLIAAITSRPSDVVTATRVVALLPAGAAASDVDEIVARAAEVDGTAIVRGDDPRVARDDLDWLTSLEGESERVLLVGDAEWTEWTDRAARTADRVFTAIDGSAASLHEVERQLLDTPEFVPDSRTVVFVHPRATDHPSGTAELLAARPGFRHLHARSGDEATLGRVARHVTGTAVCLVLSGGGARSLAAIGVFRELRRRGIAVDAVTGSSAGAVIGAGIARGDEPDDVLDRARDGFLRVRDPTLPVASILRGRRLWDKLGEHLGSGDVEDLWLPFACVSTDITDQCLVVHDRGALRLAVRASVSLPGVFAPIDIDGHLHVDGGLLDNLPVRAAEQLVPGATIVAVDVSPRTGPVVAEPLPSAISGASLLFNRILGRGSDLPSLAATVAQSVLLSASQARLAALARTDCHLDLQLPDVSLLEFGKLERIVDMGGRQASPLIDAWVEGTGSSVPREEPWRPRLPVGDDGDPDLDTTTLRAIAGSLHLAVADLRFRLRRFVVAMVAASVVLALLLLMTGVVNELDREPGVTTSIIGASHWVLPQGIESPFTSNATIDGPTAVQVTAEGEIRPALIARLPVTVDGETIDAILVGHAGDGPGRPDPADGRAATGPGEVALASFAGADVGDEIGLGSTSAQVVGTLDGATLFAGMPLAFVTIEAARDLVAGGRPVGTAVLIDGEPTFVPDALHALTRSQIIAGAKGPVERPILTLHLVRGLLAVVAAMIIGAVVYLASLERTRDVAVLRAVGTKGSMLALGVAAQALVVAIAAAVLAVVIEVLLAPVFPLTVHLAASDLLAMPVIAAVVAMLSSYAAIRRTLRIDPSEAFAGAGG